VKRRVSFLRPDATECRLRCTYELVRRHPQRAGPAPARQSSSTDRLRKEPVRKNQLENFSPSHSKI